MTNMAQKVGEVGVSVFLAIVGAALLLQHFGADQATVDWLIQSGGNLMAAIIVVGISAALLWKAFTDPF